MVGFTYSPAIVKEDSVSRQSSIDLFRYGWIHLLSAIVKEDSVSRQSSIDLFRYGWIHLPCNSKGGQCQPSI
jgi:hypothetical protein